MDVVSKVLPGKTRPFKGWTVAKAAVIQPLSLVFDKIQRAWVCPLATTGLISGDAVFPWAWDTRGLWQARLKVCEAELVAGFFTEVVTEQPGCGLNICGRCPHLFEPL